jgi:hypothetical protein
MSDESLPSPSELMATMASMAERMAQLEERLQQTSMDTSPPQDKFVVEVVGVKCHRKWLRVGKIIFNVLE